MNSNQDDKKEIDDLDEIEEELIEKDNEEKKTHHKVSGKSVFELQEIIKEKGKKSDEEYRKEEKNQ